MKHLGDITKIHGASVEPVEVIIGGSPCQDLSVAGKRAGLDGEQSGLFMEQIRIIKEMRENDRATGRSDDTIRPRYMVWENVPGAFSSNGGEDFRVVLEETAKIADPEISIPRPLQGKWTNAGCIMGNGLSIAWRTLDAQYFGVPQRRRRIALVADFGGQSAPEILFKSEKLFGNFKESRTERKRTAADAERSVDKTICYGLDHVMLSGGTTYQGRGYYENVSGCMKTQPHGVCYDARENGNGELAPTIAGDHQNRVTDYTALCIGNGQADQTGLHEIAGALNCMHDQQAVITAVDLFSAKESNINGTLLARSSNNLNSNNVCRVKNVVRRLTPLECERLQGYPDHWTDIGEWTDSKGKKHKDADSPRYKALGNSIAVPCWRFILQRISERTEEHTMASLFDGIGGFPLIWEQINGSKSCRWVSEIEEFPIAVTKIRFEQE